MSSYSVVESVRFQEGRNNALSQFLKEMLQQRTFEIVYNAIYHLVQVNPYSGIAIGKYFRACKIACRDQSGLYGIKIVYGFDGKTLFFGQIEVFMDN